MALALKQQTDQIVVQASATHDKIKQQTDQIAIQASATHDKIQILNNNLSRLLKQGFEELERHSQNSRNSGQSIEIGIVKQLDEYGAEIGKRNRQIAGQMSEFQRQIEVLVKVHRIYCNFTLTFCRMRISRAFKSL